MRGDRVWLRPRQIIELGIKKIDVIVVVRLHAVVAVVALSVAFLTQPSAVRHYADRLSHMDTAFGVVLLAAPAAKQYALIVLDGLVHDR
jgi:hypothetical protein